MSKTKVAGLLAGVLVLAVVLLQLAGVWSHLLDRSGGLVDQEALTVQRELGAAYFEEGRHELANPVLTWVVEQPTAGAQDFVNVVCNELASKDPNFPRCLELLKQAEELDPNLASVSYCRGIIAKRDVEFERARGEFERALELAPDDLPTRAHLAEVLCDLDASEEGIALYQSILDRGLEYAGAYYTLALYCMSTELIRSADPAAAQRGHQLRAEWKVLSESGLVSPSQGPMDKGNLALVSIPRPSSQPGRPPRTDPVAMERVQEGLAASVGAVRAVRAMDVDGDERPDLVVLGATGSVWLRNDGTSFSEQPVTRGDFQGLAVADVQNQGLASVLLFGAAGSRLWSQGAEGRWVASDLPSTAAVQDALFVDYDHEGDLDLLLATADGLRLLRNDGVPGAKPAEAGDATPPAAPQWTDVSADAGFPAGSFTWLDVEDFDADQDIDFLAGGQGAAPVVLSNLRKGRFEAMDGGRTGLSNDVRIPPALIDLDHDGLADLVDGGAAVVFRNRGDGTFARAESIGARPCDTPLAAADLNLDGEVDLIERVEGVLSVQAGSVLADATTAAVPLSVSWSLSQAPVVVDLDGDGDEDLIGCSGAGIDVYRNGAGTDLGRLRLLLRGEKDNRQALGAIAEVRFGSLYQRRMSRGLPLVFGLGPLTTELAAEPLDVQKKPDPGGKDPEADRNLAAARGGPEVVKVRWQNGVVQYDIHLKPKSSRRMVQKEGLIGSCPFLYTFNGERYEFITDVLGITPLGLPMVEGQYVPPDHDELVRIEGRQLAPKDGEYVMSITEELREVTYLDRAQLWVVDHPADVEVHPEERFTFPPFPPLKIHTMRGAQPIVAAVDQDGRDWTATLQQVDDVHAVPFERRPSQFYGLATPHHLDLTLPPEAADAGKVRLLMTGWFLWTDASVNIAAGQHPTIEFVPPLLMVPDERGEFRPTGPPVGFPAGKTKTMVLDVSDLLNRQDLRLRVFSTICMYWDAIRVATDDDDAPILVTRLEPTRADLDYRGFSRPIATGREDLPERFDFHELRPAPWNQHQGMLTAYGDVLPLLGEIDDRFAIFSAGDAIDLRFDATGAPALEDGQARTFLLFLDGWAKDADPNTTFTGTVEPLPFHGMSGYPYREDEGYPGDAAHEAYRAEWNTRPGRVLEWDLVKPGS